MLDQFTKKMKMKILLESEEFRAFQDFMIFKTAEYTEQLKEKTFCDLQAAQHSWNADELEYGISHLLDLIHKGIKVDFDFWTDEEKAQDESKKGTKLFYLPGKENAPFVLICSGGGFSAVCSLVDAFPVAARINELGYNVFVLSYRILPDAEPKDFDNVMETAMEDVAAGVRFIRDHQEQFKISFDDYAACGFSAGAMLMGSWCLKDQGYGKYGLPAPSSVFLAYGPVTKLDEITELYPSTYAVYCQDDLIIKPETMEETVAKIKEKNVRCQVNKGERGDHGFGLGGNSDVAGWVDQAIAFWQQK